MEKTESETERYVDVDLSFKCKDQADIDRVLKAINTFISSNSEGLQRSSINILGYSYKY